MKITSTSVSGNLNTTIDFCLFSPLKDKYKRYSHQCCIKIMDNITACLYRTGKFQIYGIKEIANLSYIYHQFLEIISPYIDISNADKELSLKFIVAAETLPFEINLSELNLKFPDEDIEYEPEQFPGAVWKMKNGTILLFNSGSIIITGCNTIQKITDIIDDLKLKLGE